MGSDLTELSKEELIRHIEILYHNMNVDYKDKCENYISKDKIRDEIESLKNMKVDGETFTTAVNFAIKILQKILEE